VGLDGFHQFILKMMGHNRVFSFVRIIGIIISMKNVKKHEPVSRTCFRPCRISNGKNPEKFYARRLNLLKKLAGKLLRMAKY